MSLNLPAAKNEVERFIKNCVRNVGAHGVIIGVSGGLDSSVTVSLASLALGADKVIGIAMPEKETYNAEDIEHTKRLVKKFPFELRIIDISSTLKACFQSLPKYSSLDKRINGNIKARLRMIYLYYYANKLNSLVCGASDKSERMLGYFTKWGDVAADFSPIKHFKFCLGDKFFKRYYIFLLNGILA